MREVSSERLRKESILSTRVYEGLKVAECLNQENPIRQYRFARENGRIGSSKEVRDSIHPVIRPGKFEINDGTAIQFKAEERHKTNILVQQKHTGTVVGRGRKIAFK